MKIYKDIKIEGSQKYLKEVLEKMKEVPSRDFKYNEELSRGMAMNLSATIDSVGCFVALTKNLFHSKVYVDINYNRSTDKYFVWIPNIVSKDKDHLDKDEYNFVLDTFVEDVIEKSVPKEHIEITDSEVHLADKITAESYHALERWEHTSDHNAPFAHPSDMNKWIAFLSLVFKNNDYDKINSSDLDGWLREDKGWSVYQNDVINEIISYYEYGITLLKYYNDQYSK